MQIYTDGDWGFQKTNGLHSLLGSFHKTKHYQEIIPFTFWTKRAAQTFINEIQFINNGIDDGENVNTFDNYPIYVQKSNRLIKPYQIVILTSFTKHDKIAKRKWLLKTMFELASKLPQEKDDADEN